MVNTVGSDQSDSGRQWSRQRAARYTAGAMNPQRDGSSSKPVEEIHTLLKVLYVHLKQIHNSPFCGIPH